MDAPAAAAAAGLRGAPLGEGAVYHAQVSEAGQCSCVTEAGARSAAQAIELKEAAQNPLLGAHHLEASGRFVSAVTPGLGGVQRDAGSAAGGGADHRDRTRRDAPGVKPRADPDRGWPHAGEELDWDGEEGDAAGSELGSPRLGQGALGELRSVTQAPRERRGLGPERATAA